MVEEALNKGCKIVWATTGNKNMLNKAKKLNYNVLDKKHSIIYKYL
jgi:phosphomannomutase